MATVAATAVERSRSRRLSRATGLAALGLLSSAATLWVVADSPTLVQPTSTALLRAIYVATAICVGLYMWWSRPHGSLGLSVAGIGFLYAVSSLNASDQPVVYALGMTAWAAYFLYVAHVYLAFPRERLGSAREQAFFSVYVGATALIWTLVLVFADKLPSGGPFTYCGDSCPRNGLQLVNTSHGVGRALMAAFLVAVALGLAGVAALIIGKARSSTRLRRRAAEPLAYVFVGTIVVFVLSVLLLPSYPGTRDAFRVWSFLLAVAGPLAILAGQLRGSAFATRMLGQLVAKTGGEAVSPAWVQSTMREALGDRTLEVALWSPRNGGYVDVGGHSFELPSDPAARAVTPVARGERPVAALVHDPTLDESPELLEGLTATSLMLLENTKLVEELRASRARIVATAEDERVRLERDLHDGAQQMLMMIQIKLALAREAAGSDDASVKLGEIEVDAAAAVEELRVLAHGIYPTVLRERGLSDALRSSTTGSPVHVAIVDHGVGRCSSEIEAAVYFCSLEAIQNAVKHAGPDARVTVTLGRRATGISFEIADDGTGFEPGEHDEGMGLVSMRDRIGAVGGELEVQSRPGGGTAVYGFVPAP